MQHTILKERHELDMFFRKVDSFVQWIHFSMKLFLYVSVFICILSIISVNYDSYYWFGHKYYSMMYDKNYIITNVPYLKYVFMCIEEAYIIVNDVLVIVYHSIRFLGTIPEPKENTNKPNIHIQQNTSIENEPDGLLDMFLISLYGLL